jgi:transketolase
LEGILAAIEEAQKVKDKPTCIKVTTTIGFGSLLQGTHSVHGAALKADDIVQLKKKFGFDPEKTFDVPDEVYQLYHKTAAQGAEIEKKWDAAYAEYKKAFPELGAELERRIKKELPKGWEAKLPVFKPSDAAVASRKLSEIVLSAIWDELPELVGGSADLTGSNLTRTKQAIDFQPPSTKLGNFAGRYFRFGVREHGMGAILNGIAAYGTFIPYGGTFLNFVSYAAGAVRLSALSRLVSERTVLPTSLSKLWLTCARSLTSWFGALLTATRRLLPTTRPSLRDTLRRSLPCHARTCRNSRARPSKRLSRVGMFCSRRRTPI